MSSILFLSIDGESVDVTSVTHIANGLLSAVRKIDQFTISDPNDPGIYRFMTEIL